MRILLAEDDFVTRKFMMNFLSSYGECDAAVDGMEAVDAYLMALEDGEPYDLACLDIMMPVMDGYQVLRSIRDLEADHGIPEEEQVKVIMTTALNDEESKPRSDNAGNAACLSGMQCVFRKADQQRKIRSGIKEIRLDIERSLSWQTILILAICSVFIYLKTSSFWKICRIS